MPRKKKMGGGKRYSQIGTSSRPRERRANRTDKGKRV